MSDDEPQRITRYEWERIMRRVRLNAPMAKYVGMMLAQYANTDGTNAFPSVDKLARVCEVSEKTVRTGLGELRERGLVIRTRKGGLRGTQAVSDCYDLAIPADLLDANELLPPDESPLPNRQDVPAGKPVTTRPNRNVGDPQPVTDASQPVTEGVPTGTSYRLPNPYQPKDLTPNQRGDRFEEVSTESPSGRNGNVIDLHWRRGA